MKRRSKVSGGRANSQRSKAPKARPRKVPKAARGLRSATINEEVTRLTRERDEARHQQIATANILRVISQSPTDVRDVIDSIVLTAARSLRCDLVFVFICDGASFSPVSGATPERLLTDAGPADLPIDRGLNFPSRAILDKKMLHLPDWSVTDLPEHELKIHKLFGVNSALYLPLLRDKECIGLLTLTGKKPNFFGAVEIAQAEFFRDQALIAINNARLLTELRQSLERQTATSEVLQVISSSPGELQPVFAKILESAARICEVSFGVMSLREDDVFRVVGMHNAPPAYVELRRREPTWRLTGPLGRAAEQAIATKRAVQIVDLAEGSYQDDATSRDFSRTTGARSFIIVPLLKENTAVGLMAVYRQEVRPFNDKHVELLTNFAAQAVIAIENARLLKELRQRTDDLSESLERQTATSKVLEVISSSLGDLRPVFAEILENAVRLCGAKFGNLYLYETDGLRTAAMHNAPPAFAEQRAGIVHPSPHSTIHRVLETKLPAQTADITKLQAYIDGDPWVISTVSLGGYRGVLSVPMLHDDELIGAITVFRREAGTFTEKQIKLLQNFAAQAVIAIENVRLLKELRERTEDVEKLNKHLEQRVSDQVGEIERMGRLRRFLPPQVADLIVASGSEKELESHRREITALFCDLRGFTGFSESADPEDVMALLRDYHAAIGNIIIKYSGTLERYAGDGVMVVFNDPVPVENPALQAVLMALEMRGAIGALTETWRRLGHDIGFGIGIAHGFATLGTIGFEGRFDYAAIGTVSNVASRLCDEAKPGQILISPRVLLNVENAVKVEPVGEFELKGIRRPLAAYNVVAPVSGIVAK